MESDIRDALDQLKSAADAGLFQNPQMATNAAHDDDLEILRDHVEFKRLIEPHKAKP